MTVIVPIIAGGPLFEAVEALVSVFMPLPDAMMDRAWAFKAYDEEGLRFALLQTGQELRELAALTYQVRTASDRPITTAQRILAQYHIAYRDLYGAWCGLTEADFDRAPAENDWAVRRTTRHMMGTASFFLTVIGYAVDRQRTGGSRPENLPDDGWQALVKPFASQFGIDLSTDIITGTFAEVKTRFDALHNAVLSQLAGVQEAELEWPSWWWEDYAQTIRFRLLRLEAHLRQHTVQVEKIRVALGYIPSESHRLIRQLYNALGEAESAAIGALEPNRAAKEGMLDLLRTRTNEISALLKQ